jgi:hypothetical protein
MALFVKIVVLASNKFEKLLIVADMRDSCGRSVLRETPQVQSTIHRLVNLKDIGKIKVLLKTLELNKKQIEKVNELRKQCINDLITN